MPTNPTWKDFLPQQFLWYLDVLSRLEARYFGPVRKKKGKFLVLLYTDTQVKFLNSSNVCIWMWLWWINQSRTWHLAAAPQPVTRRCWCVGGRSGAFTRHSVSCSEPAASEISGMTSQQFVKIFFCRDKLQSHCCRMHFRWELQPPQCLAAVHVWLATSCAVFSPMPPFFGCVSVSDCTAAPPFKGIQSCHNTDC